MSMISRLWYINLGCATAALVAGYALGGLWIWVPLILCLPILGLLGQLRGWKWTPSLEFLFFAGLAASGLWLKLAPGLMLLGMIAALTAWDLESFLQRLEEAGKIEHRDDLERKHLIRLLIVGGSSALLAVSVLSIDMNFSFGLTLLLGLLAVVGLSRTIGYLRRESN